MRFGRVVAALAVVGAAIAVVLIASGGSSYRVRLELASADGIRNGSQVKVGGVPVGTVASLHLGRGDVVEADLNLDAGHKIGPDTTAELVPSNLLGSTFVQLVPGRQPATEPSGALITPDRVRYPVQLDQVLNVLDADTRTRLGILVNEAGVAMTGRKMDFNHLLSLLPNDFSDGARLLGQVVADNHTLAALIRHSNNFIAELVPQRTELTQLIRAAGETMQTTAARRLELRQTLALAPGTLASAQRFLADLRATALPLGPAAQAINAAAPQLTGTLAALPAFQRAAQPALNTAVQVSPLLTQLGTQATPVIVRANPTVAAAADFARAAGPLFSALNVSIDDALGLVEGWARSIQGRDYVGHVFHGRALVGPELVRSLISQLSPPASKHGAAKANPQLSITSGKTPTAGAGAPSAPPPANGASGSPSSGLGQLLSGVLGKLVPGHNPLGQILSGLGGTSNAHGATSNARGGPSLGSLLNYLLGP